VSWQSAFSEFLLIAFGALVALGTKYKVLDTHKVMEK
jgi:hypothetical protein